MAEWRPLEIAGHGGRDFVLRSPLMPAAGFLGYGRAYPGLLDAVLFGALVTQATTLNARGPRQWPGFARVRGGFILPLPAPNPGIGAMLREFAPSWRRWRVPVIVALSVADSEEAGVAAARLDEEDSVSGIELQVPPGAGPEWLAAILGALKQRADLPLLVRLPLAEAPALAEGAIDAGAAALVLGIPHHGTQARSGLHGPLYGPAALPYTLRAVQEVGERSLPVIASGGVYSADDVRACLDAGAQAVQIDGLIPLDPASAANIARTYAPTRNPVA